MRAWKKFTAFFMAMAMTFSLMPAAVMAAETDDTDSDSVYVTMNVPYYDFYTAVNSKAEQADEYSKEPSVDAESFATTKYGLSDDGEGKRSTSGTSKGTYNDGESVKGFYYAVKMDEDTYKALKDLDLNAGDDYYFGEDDVLAATPASYLTLSYENDTYTFTDDGMAKANGEDGEVADIGDPSYINSYGDYFFELLNVDTGKENPDIGTTNIDGEAVTIAGELINFSDGSSFAMYRCDNDWMGTRYPFELSWNVDGGHDYRKGHNNSDSPLLYHYNMTSYKMTSVSIYTDKGVYEYTCDVDWLPYYIGENTMSVAANDGDQVITLTDIPNAWEDVTVSVYYSVSSGRSSTEVYVAKDVAVGADGAVTLDEAIDCAANGTYTILIQPANYAPTAVVLDVPMSEAQKQTLTDLIAEGEALLEQVDHSTLAEHVEEAKELLQDEDAMFSDAQELIDELSGYIEEAKAMVEEQGSEEASDDGTSAEKQEKIGATVGSTVTVGKNNYKVLTSTTVAFAGTKASGSVVIPATVTINKKSYKVTQIADNAFKGNTKVKKITIGKNISKIGKKAFFKAKNLKKITVKTKKLTAKNIGKQAFKKAGMKNYKKLTVKVPKAKKKQYKKAFQKKGLSKKAKVK